MGYSGRKPLGRLNLFDKMWLYPHKDFEAFKYRQPRFRKEASNSPPPPPKKERWKGGELLGRRGEEVRIAAKQ